MKVGDTKGLYNVCKYYWENSKKQLKIPAQAPWNLTITLYWDCIVHVNNNSTTVSITGLNVSFDIQKVSS